MSDSAKSARRKIAEEYREKEIRVLAEVEAKQERIAKEEAQKRFDAYWTEHADKKIQLEAERDSLNDQLKVLQSELNDKLSEYNKEMAALPCASEIASFDERIKQLSSEKSALGVFKGKEKKAIQEQIDQTSAERKAVQDRMDAAKRAIQTKIDAAKSESQKKTSPLQNRIHEIYTELTKER